MLLKSIIYASISINLEKIQNISHTSICLCFTSKGFQPLPRLPSWMQSIECIQLGSLGKPGFNWKLNLQSFQKLGNVVVFL